MRKDIWVRVADLETWNAIPDKPEWLHQQLQKEKAKQKRATSK